MSHSDPAYGRKLSRAGLSAYEIAEKNGFVGDEAAWLLSLVGPAGADGVDGTNGTNGTNGADGADGASAYEVAVSNGFVGDEAAWLLSLVGPAGADGADGIDGAPGAPGADGLPGADGAPGPAGADGDSAYEVAVANGFVGTEAAWLASLVGPAGADGADGANGADGADAPLIPVQILAAPDKTTPADADTLGYLDSTASNALVKFTWANIKAALQTFFEGLFRTKLSAPRTYYVRADGNDSNNGLSNTAGGAFLTLQKAVDVVAALDVSLYQVTIHVGTGTYAPVVLKAYTGAVAPLISGDTSTPSNVTINATAASANAIFAADAGAWKIAGLKMQASGTNGSGIRAEGRTTLAITGYTEFGACSGRHIFAYRSSVLIQANIRISGGASSCLEAGYPGGIISYTSGYTCTLSGTPAFSSGFATVTGLAMCVVNGITFSGSATGPRYVVTTNGIIQTFGSGATYLPGSAAGTILTGGQYS